jgi:hypothetical protein
MVCECLPGFGGPLCESPAEQCGNINDHVCLNGGECITSTVQTPDGNVRSQHRCDCAMATNDNNDSFAGKYCEHKATSMCSNSDWNFFCTQVRILILVLNADDHSNNVACRVVLCRV